MPGERWIQTRVNNTPLLNSIINLLNKSTIHTMLLLLNNIIRTKPHPSNIKVDTTRTRTKATVNNRTTVAPHLNNTVETSTTTVRKDSINRVRPKDNGIIKETSITNNTTINLLKIMVVGDPPVDTGVRDDLDDLINMIDEMK
jgi:hypothetical protein